LGPIKTPLGLPAAVQAGFLGWGNGLDRGFRVATGRTVFAPIFGVQWLRPSLSQVPVPPRRVSKEVAKANVESRI
jgi:hypothetical protein